MSAALRELVRIKDAYGPGCAARKLALLRVLARQALSSTAAIVRLHEALCFLRAYPDVAEVLRAVERILTGFARRPDFKRRREALADTGIVDTTLRFRFFWPTARWLARRWPDRLAIDPADEPAWQRIEAALPSLVSRAQAEALRELQLPARTAIARLKDRRTSDAVFFVRSIASMPGDDFSRETLHDGVDATYVFRSGSGTPSRTLAKELSVPIVFQENSIRRDRPDLRKEIHRPPAAIRFVQPEEGARLIELARGAMMTRARDLDAFAYADPRDVRIVDDGGGLAFIAIGVVPERRALLPAIYGYLTLRNGVPIGYVQTDALGSWAAVAFNTFDAFRGGEAAYVFARVLAMTKYLFGTRSFTIEPYQLGAGNLEGIASGAWWFYYKMGFRPRDGEVRRVAKRELARMKRSRHHRSSAPTLERLAARHLFFDLDPRRPGRLPPLAEIGMSKAPAAGASRELMRRLGVPTLARWLPAERLAWSRFVPWLSSLPGLERWSAAERRALVRVVRAKGARRESDYVTLFAAHRRLAQIIRSAATAHRRPRA